MDDSSDRTDFDNGCKRSLVIQFNPPAFLQRRAFVLATLKKLEPKCQTLLDVGTGEGGLLAFLVRCDDDVPITTMIGIDPDAKALDLAAAAIAPTNKDHEDLRWNPLKISLCQGGVKDLQAATRTFDCITAIEVLEHLDPPDVDALSKKCLGELKPRCFIVTTPNRDFNAVFSKLDPHDKHAYTRPDVDYKMRHSDHRFEMTRAEFQSWARSQCKIYGYDVDFHGLGSVANAFTGQSDWRKVFNHENLDHMYGCSTQVAVFTRRSLKFELLAANLEEMCLSDSRLLSHVMTYRYPWTDLDGYPPSHEQLRCIVVESEAYFRPMYDSTRSYTSKNQIEVTVGCKQFFDTCYSAQRVSRFDFGTFLRCAKSMLHEKIQDIARTVALPKNVTSDHVSEPVATFVKAHFDVVDHDILALIFTFDTSSFSQLVEPLSLYDTAYFPASNSPIEEILQVEWDLSLDDQTLAATDERMTRLEIGTMD